MQTSDMDLGDNQWDQVTLSVRKGDLALRNTTRTTDATYLVSWTSSLAKCKAIRPDHVHGSAQEQSTRSVYIRLNGQFPHDCQLSPWDPETKLRQKILTTKVEDTLYDSLCSTLQPIDRARLIAHSTQTSIKWQGTIPSRTLDTAFTNQDFVFTTELQLGVDVHEEAVLCNFCGMMADCKGRHALSCMAGGDHTTRHNDIRDEVFHWCSRARLHPHLEKTGLLHHLGTPDVRRRPADVLICRRSGFLHDLPGGNALVRNGQVALDFAVINALGQGHLDRTLEGPLHAAIAYSQRKSSYKDTRAACAAENIAFEPIVFEAQGGVEPRGAAILHRIAEAVATVEGKDVVKIKSQMLQRLAVILARGCASAIRRRDVSRNVSSLTGPSTRLLRECATLRYQ